MYGPHLRGDPLSLVPQVLLGDLAIELRDVEAEADPVLLRERLGQAEHRRGAPGRRHGQGPVLGRKRAYRSGDSGGDREIERVQQATAESVQAERRKAPRANRGRALLRFADRPGGAGEEVVLPQRRVERVLQRKQRSGRVGKECRAPARPA